MPSCVPPPQCLGALQFCATGVCGRERSRVRAANRPVVDDADGRRPPKACLTPPCGASAGMLVSGRSGHAGHAGHAGRAGRAGVACVCRDPAWERSGASGHAAGGRQQWLQPRHDDVPVSFPCPVFAGASAVPRPAREPDGCLCLRRGMGPGMAPMGMPPQMAMQQNHMMMMRMMQVSRYAPSI